MSRLDQTFAASRAQGRAALIAYLPVGVPSVAGSEMLVHDAAGAGADAFELGVPFSDALTDGRVIREATQVALNNRVTVRTCLEVVQRLRRDGLTQPIVVMGSLNPFAAYGLDRLADDAATAGMDGFLVSDLPSEEAHEWCETLARRGLANIGFIAPNTTHRRLHTIAAEARGFLYCYAAEVTGARRDLTPGLERLLSRVRQVTPLPLAVGYGLSTAAQVRQVSQWADAVVIGSLFADTILRTAPKRVRSAFAAAVRHMAAATSRDTTASRQGIIDADPV